jgi:hypothetical protein
LNEPDRALGDPQERLFNPDRYAPTTVAALLRLPEGNARSFVAASALGRIVRSDGTFGSLRSARDAGGTTIGPRERTRILTTLGIGERRWRQLVDDWERRYIAHRCKGGTVCLFARPMPATCPACHSTISFPAMPPSTTPRRVQTGSTPAAQPAGVLPSRGTRTAAQGERGLPLSVAEGAHPKSGAERRDEEGVAAPGSILRDATPSTPSDRERACPECGFWPHHGDHSSACSSFRAPGAMVSTAVAVEQVAIDG